MSLSRVIGVSLAAITLAGGGVALANGGGPPPPPPGALENGMVDESKLPDRLPLLGRNGAPVVDRFGQPVTVDMKGDEPPPIEQFYGRGMSAVAQQFRGCLPAVMFTDANGKRRVQPADPRPDKGRDRQCGESVTFDGGVETHTMTVDTDQ